ncbi:MAG: OmpA family protein [Bacteroidia bacterium]|nr:OmpA family protein [Bacteroidia bacterium]
MKRTLSKLFSAIALLIIFQFSASAQKVQIEKANELYNNLDYSKAIVAYEEILKKHPDLTSIKVKLAECYRLTARTEKAEYWLAQVVKSHDATSQHKLMYARALLSNGNFKEAKSWVKDYLVNNPDDRSANFLLSSIENLPKYYKDTGNYFIWKLIINSQNADFSPVLFNNGIVFASSRETKGLFEKKHTWTGEPFLHLYYSKGKGNTFLEAEPFATDVQIRYNDGPVCFNNKGDEIYITRNNVVKRKEFTSQDGEVKLKLFIAKNINSQWKNPVSFKYNNDEFNTGHAFLSVDENYLFFSSDRPGGLGGMDIWMCKRNGNDWDEPVNLGSQINTSGNELFPYMHADSTFLFASDGRDGIGGLDIYYSKWDGSKMTEARNMGAPVNSSGDDFGVAFDKKTHYGYFSSNRETRSVDDDIYSFRRLLKVQGIVVEKGTDNPVEHAKVKLKNSKKTELEFQTMKDGKFEFPIDYDESYLIEASKELISRDIESFNTLNYFPSENLFVKLELEKQERKFNLIVKVLDEKTKKPLDKAEIAVDQSDVVLGYTDKEGLWTQPLERDLKKTLMITRSGYDPKVVTISNLGQRVDTDFEVTVELSKGNDVGPYARWYKIIYYDFDKSNIRPDAVKTMMEVLQFVKEHPDARLLMNSYCDSRGTTAYNMKLSERRAKAATQWLINNGANQNSVEKMDWGGKTMLMNRCAEGVDCTEDEHQLNRRTEIRVYRVESRSTSKTN